MERQMTLEYARLSLRFAFLCANADNWLGKAVFTVVARLMAWEFTEELLNSTRAKAISMGVPEGVLDLTPEQEQLVHDDVYLARLMDKQAEVDAKRAGH